MRRSILSSIHEPRYPHDLPRAYPPVPIRGCVRSHPAEILRASSLDQFYIVISGRFEAFIARPPLENKVLA